jgi:hypothetical protein
MLDGHWSENTLFAVRAFRDARGLGVGDTVDARTYAALRDAALDRPALTSYPLSDADVRGPYRPVPKGVRQKASAPCLCYASLLERLSERFHATPALLRTLNPTLDFATAPAGTRVVVPNTWRLPPKERVARLVVTKREGSVRGLAADGRTLFFLPATVGSTAMPSPHGQLASRASRAIRTTAGTRTCSRTCRARRACSCCRPGPTRRWGACGWR